MRGSSSNFYVLYLLDVVIKEKPDDNLLGADNISFFLSLPTAWVPCEPDITGDEVLLPDSPS